MQLYTKTEKFHKALNEELKDVLSFEKRPGFRKWYCFEAMSGLKKFKNKQSVASICATFDPNTGKVSTIPVTSDGKAKGLSEKPSVSSEIETLAEKIKKVIRDGVDYGYEEEFRADLTKELGDVLWYVAALASDLNISLDDVAEKNVQKLASRKKRNKIGGSGDNR